MDCPACGATASPDNRFCSACGALLARPPGLVASGPVASVPKELARRMREARTAIEGERKQVTILFADITSSTALIEALDPELAAAILRPPLQAMIDAVHRYEGTVNRVQGDGIMALFGAPLAHEDNAVRAAFAALEMQSAIERLRDERIAIRVGLHSGEVVVQSLNNDLSVDYDAVGASVHLASRMERLAEPGTICCTEAVARQAEGLVKVEPRGRIAVPGISQPVETYCVVGHKPARTRWEVSTTRGLSPFAGREAELAALGDVLAEASAGRGQAVTVVGDVGCGKTRLVHEFIHRSQTQDWSVLRAAATPRSAETPYLAISTMMRARFGIGASDPVAETVRRVTAQVLDFGEDLAPILPAIRALLDLPVEDAEWAALDSAERRKRTIHALTSIAIRGSARTPTLYWFEDMQWIDAETRSLLRAFAPLMQGSRCILVVTFRSGYDTAWTDVAHHRLIAIEPLEQSSAATLVCALLGDVSCTRQLHDLIIRRTDGIPLFIEETVRDLVERGALVGGPGAYAMVGAIDTIQIPATVGGVLSARIDRLHPEKKALLQVASVVGREVPVTFLRDLSELSPAAFQDALETFENAELLRVSPSGVARVLVFKHALTQEIAYGSLLLRQRRALHARVVRLIEEHYAPTIGEHVEDLGYHAMRGELWDEAVRYLGQAGAKAVEISAYGQAKAFLEQALEAASRLPDTEETVRRGIDIRLALREILGATVEFGRVQVLLREAEAMATRIGDDRRLAQISIAMTFVLNISGQLDASVTTGLRAAALAKRLGHGGMTVVASFYLAQAHLWRGEVSSTRDILASDTGWVDGPLRQMRIGTTVTASVLWLNTLGSAHAYLGAFDAALAACGKARALADERSRPYDLGFSLFSTGFVQSHAGRVDEALSALRHGLAVATDNRVQMLIPILSTSLGYAEALAGNGAKGVALLERVVQVSRTMGMPYLEGHSSAYLGYAKLLHDRPDDALADVVRALEVARAHRLRGVEASSLRFLGMCWMRGGNRDLDRAERSFRDAAAMATDLRLRPDQAHCRAEIALLQELRGDHAAAARSRSEAKALYEELGMGFWAQRVGQSAPAPSKA